MRAELSEAEARMIEIGWWAPFMQPLDEAFGQWYIARGDVRRAVRSAIELQHEGCERQVEIAGPMEWRQVRNPKTRTRERVRRPMLGSYFFVRADLPASAARLALDPALRIVSRESALMTAMQIGMIRAIEGIDDLLGCDERGFPLPARRRQVINSLMNGVDKDALPPVDVDGSMVFDDGAWVIVQSGPFKGMSGQVERLDNRLDKKALTRVLMSIMGRSVPFEVNTELLVRSDCADHPAAG